MGVRNFFVFIRNIFDGKAGLFLRLTHLVTLSLLALASQAVSAGGNTCITTASGNWSEPTIWDCGGGGTPPGSSDFVTIQNGHTVLLDQDATVNNLVVAAGGDLDVAASAMGYTLSWDESGSDLSHASIDLAGDFFIVAENPGDDIDFVLGSVDGGFNFSITNDGNTTFAGELGGVAPLAFFSVDNAGSNTWMASLTTSGSQQHRGQSVIAGEVTWTGQSVDVSDFLDADMLAGDRNLTINSTNAPSMQNTITGATVPLSSFTVNAIGSNLNTLNPITTTGEQIYNCDVAMEDALTLTASRVTFNGTPFSDTGGPAGFDLTINGDVLFTHDLNRANDRGNIISVENLTVTGNAEFNISGGGTITTNSVQNYQGGITLSDDTTLTSSDGGNIFVRDSTGPHHLTVNTSGITYFIGTVGATAHTSVTTDASGRAQCSNGSTIQVDSDTTATTFNDRLRIGPTAVCTVEQFGAADVIFNGPVDQFSGGPKRLFVNDVSGRTVFNNTVDLGLLETNDGAGDDVTVINTSSVQTTQGGSNPGTMTFNDPVQLMQSVNFNTTNAGQIFFNNTVDAVAGVNDVDVLITSGTTTQLGPVGTLNPVRTLTTDLDGATQLDGDVITSGDQIFDDPVIVNANLGLVASDLFFNSTVDLQNFDFSVTADEAAFQDVVSGSGRLISNIGFALALNANNTYTGETQILSGDLNLGNALINNNIASSNLISLSGSTRLIPSSMSNQFDLQSGQILAGAGEVQQMLTAPAGSLIRPGNVDGNDIGTLTTDSVTMTGAALEIQLDGGAMRAGGPGQDQLSVGTLNLDPSTVLNLEVITAVPAGQQFTIVDVNSTLTGEFSGLPEGSMAMANDGSRYAITYLGGDGNDIVLTAQCESAIMVTSNADSGTGTLRQGVSNACPGGLITFAGDMTIGLDSEIAVNDEVSIDGSGFSVVISGNNTHRVFNVGSAGDLSLHQLTVSDAFSNSEGGAIRNAGMLSVTDSLFENNYSDGNGYGGGAFFNDEGAVASIFGVTFSNNDAPLGGAVFNNLSKSLPNGMLTITNSTFSGNGATTAEGGAIHNRGVLVSTNNTIANNGTAGTMGGGLYTWQGDQTLINTIIADNTGDGDCRINLGNSTQASTASLIETGNCTAALTDDPLLQPLDHYGGNTPTIGLTLQSPAIDAGDLGLCPPSDQRGVLRPQLGGCDIGAFESESLGIVYVNTSSPRGGCVAGECWANAYTTLQDAIDVAVSGAEIWVAQGVYRPDEGANALNNDPVESFTIPAGVGVYGGFDGTETSRNQRDPNANVTILSGDIDNDDLNADGNQIAELVSDIQGTNAYHVVTTLGASDIVVDGFTITAGSAFGSVLSEQRGGGINCGSDASTDALINDTVFIGNQAEAAGGAMSRCNNTISNVLFISNASDGPGGAAWLTSAANLRNVSFEFNAAAGNGGALWGVNLDIDQGRFAGNQASLDGGALYSLFNILVSNSEFSGNAATQMGGAMYLATEGVLDNVTVSGNRSDQAGGAIVFDSDGAGGNDLAVRNGVIWNNEDVNGVGTVSTVTGVGTPEIGFSNTLFQGSGGSANWDPQAGTDNGGNIDENPLFIEEVDLISLPSAGGNLRPEDGSPVVDAGNNAFVTTAQDLDGEARIQVGTVDMGAYEGAEPLFADSFEN